LFSKLEKILRTILFYQPREVLEITLQFLVKYIGRCVEGLQKNLLHVPSDVLQDFVVARKDTYLYGQGAKYLSVAQCFVSTCSLSK